MIWVLLVLAFLYAFERFIRVVESGRFNVRIVHLHVSDVPVENIEKYSGGIPSEEQIDKHIREVNKEVSAPVKARSPFGGAITIKRRK